MKTIEMDVEEVEKMVKLIKKTRRDTAKIMRSYKAKRFGKVTNEFGMPYNRSYLDGILQALELSLMHLGYGRKEINTKKTLDFLISELEKQGME